jgi:AcrR family transcriptional regulator
VSVGLLYRYFPSKRAIVMALYDDLSAELVSRAADLSAQTWRERFLWSLKTSLEYFRESLPLSSQLLVQVSRALLLSGL